MATNEQTVREMDNFESEAYQGATGWTDRWVASQTYRPWIANIQVNNREAIAIGDRSGIQILIENPDRSDCDVWELSLTSQDDNGYEVYITRSLAHLLMHSITDHQHIESVYLIALGFVPLNMEPN